MPRGDTVEVWRVISQTKDGGLKPAVVPTAILTMPFFSPNNRSVYDHAAVLSGPCHIADV